jgi:flagellar motor switch protein FliG
MADPQLTSGLSGAQSAAVFLLGLGEEPASEIMKLLQPREVQRIGEAMGSLPQVSSEQLLAVVNDFQECSANITSIGMGAKEFTLRVLIKALGESKARAMYSKVLPGAGQGTDATRGVEALRWMDASSIAGLLADEHPQIVAMVLASLEEDQASQVLLKLSRELRNETILRLARLEVLDAAAVEELDKVLERQLGDVRPTPPRSVNGANTAASILNLMTSQMEEEMLNAIIGVDEVVGERVRELMFVFENLADLDERSMQRLIREISMEMLTIALKGVEERVQNHFFRNMSQRAAEMLQDDMEAKGPVKVSEVGVAQKEILAIARKLSDDGEITLRKSSDDFV